MVRMRRLCVVVLGSETKAYFSDAPNGDEDGGSSTQ